MSNLQETRREKKNDDFESYQRQILGFAGYLAMTRFTITQSRDKFGKHYSVENSSSLALISFYLQTINTLLKLIYLSHLLLNKYSTIPFLDKIAVSCYLLIVAQMVILYWIWLPKYPLFEIIYRSWQIENDIYKSLGSPQMLKKRVNGQLKVTVWVHSLIAYIGSLCFVIQYSGNPKYYLWSYAIIDDSESWILFSIFGVHEFICMFYAWNLMVGANGIFAAQAAVFANLINEMAHAVNRLQRETYLEKQNGESVIKIEVGTLDNERSYDDIGNILFDYERLLLIIEEYNKCVSYKTVFLHIIGYSQFIADCFVVFQVLRIPGTGIRDIWFFVEDCAASSMLIYRVYNLMSRVEQASQSFFKELKHYLRTVSSFERKSIKMRMARMKLVSMKLGPCPVTRKTVLSAMDTLSNYYICVAFWS